jgi:hypothetical protein
MRLETATGRGWRRPRARAALSVAAAVTGLVLAPPMAALAAGSAARAGPAAAQRWIPPLGNVPWQWELDHPLRLDNARDMGTGVRTYTGKPAPNPVVYDIDLFDNPASTVAALHARGDHVICYMEVGAAEDWRPDYHEFRAAALGRKVPGWPGERYVDIRNAAVLRIVEARLRLCARKGFDAVEPDIDDSFTDPTGFHITEAQNVAYDVTLANYAHSLGLSFGLKNGDEPSFAAAMLPHVDFALAEQCLQYRTCGAFSPRFRRAGKAVFEVEYSLRRADFCPRALADGFTAMRQSVALAGGRAPCS